MTNTQTDGTNLVVVDGSNIATEGRSIPSLAQLNDAVISLTEEFTDISVTVVVDATFGHRINKSEVAEFDEAVAHNELVTPPAGAIGRGDAFVLSIANKVGARIFSNDSFQEFHGTYPWLFDEGRLIGGKPVPNVGWVFVNRVPVRGPVSRKARGASRDGDGDGNGSRRTASKLASLPMPIPTSPPPRRAVDEPELVAAAATPKRSRRRRTDQTETVSVPPIGRETTGPVAATIAVPPGGPVNELLPFLDFVEHHPIGSSVTGVVESYSSHGAYVTIGDLRGYVPLRLMGNPPPRSAREVMRSGEAVTLVVSSFAPARRSVDLAVPAVGAVPPLPAEPATTKPARRRAATKSAAVTNASTDPVAADEQPPARGRRAKKVAGPASVARSVLAKKAAGRRASRAAADESGVSDAETTAKAAASTSTPPKRPATKRSSGVAEPAVEPKPPTARATQRTAALTDKVPKEPAGKPSQSSAKKAQSTAKPSQSTAKKAQSTAKKAESTAKKTAGRSSKGATVDPLQPDAEKPARRKAATSTASAQPSRAGAAGDGTAESTATRSPAAKTTAARRRPAAKTTAARRRPSRPGPDDSKGTTA